MPGGHEKRPDFRKRPLSQDAPQKAFAKMVRAEERDQDITIYSLRHTYATMALRSGVDLRTLQKRMGHSDFKTTMEYLHFSDQRPLYRRGGEGRRLWPGGHQTPVQRYQVEDFDQRTVFDFQWPAQRLKLLPQVPL